MEKTFVGAAPGNFASGRAAGMKPGIIVLHSANGTLGQTDARYNTPGDGLSSHYAIGPDGAIHVYVKEEDTAFHAGLAVNATSSEVLARPRTNPNFYSIGIDFAGAAGTLLTPAQIEAGAALIRDVATRWGIPLDAIHVVRHSEIRASVNCPGAALDVAALLQSSATPPAVSVAAALSVSLVSKVNVRRQPSTAGALIRTMASGETVAVAGFTNGDSVNGNSAWYVLPQGGFFWAGATDHPNPAVNPGATTDAMEAAQPEASGAEPPINRTKYRFNNLQAGSPRKNLVLLHFTAGPSAESAVSGWIAHVAVPYVIDADGTIYELFDPGKWAFHLGIKGDPHHVQDMRSIGIEIANFGPLKKSANQLNAWPGDFTRKFCNLTETDRYIQQSYRNFEYFAKYPDVQMNSVVALVNYLCARFQIPKQLAPAEKRFLCDPAFYGNFTGIATHANFRQDKWDIGPAFDWAALGL
jgi:N-acetyl-anhydromuramyl-L-alanine amidase AmpD